MRTTGRSVTSGSIRPATCLKSIWFSWLNTFRKVQPQARRCSGVGHGMGDYASHGDMAVPPKNVEGLWETCDTTNDFWSDAG